MKRREVLAGLGSLAAAGATVSGTGAFTQVDAQRRLTGAVVDDGRAQLGLKLEGQNSEYARYNDRGRLVVDVPDLNSRAITTLGGIFRVVNQTGTGDETNGETIFLAVQEDLDTPANGFCTFFAGEPPTSIGSDGRIPDRSSLEVEDDGHPEILGPGENTLVGIQFGIGDADVGGGTKEPIGGPFRLVATTDWNGVDDLVNDDPDYP
jgi:hypothetical protein